MIKITKETVFGETKWGFVLTDASGNRVTRQLPCWDRRKDAVASAQFHRQLLGVEPTAWPQGAV